MASLLFFFSFQHDIVGGSNFQFKLSFVIWLKCTGNHNVIIVAWSQRQLQWDYHIVGLISSPLLISPLLAIPPKTKKKKKKPKKTHIHKWKHKTHKHAQSHQYIRAAKHQENIPFLASSNGDLSTKLPLSNKRFLVSNNIKSKKKSMIISYHFPVKHIHQWSAE